MSTAQTARTTILSTPKFKAWLSQEARKEGISVSELIRQRCKPAPGDEQALLADLVAELRAATRRADAALTQGLEDANAVLSELRAKREKMKVEKT